MNISIKLVCNAWQFSLIFNPRQIIFIDSNSRLVVDEDDNVMSGLKGLTKLFKPLNWISLWYMVDPDICLRNCVTSSQVIINCGIATRWQQYELSPGLYYNLLVLCQKFGTSPRKSTLLPDLRHSITFPSQCVFIYTCIYFEAKKYIICTQKLKYLYWPQTHSSETEKADL